MASPLPEPSRSSSASPTERELETEMPGGMAAAGHDPYAALRLPNYRRFIAGVMVGKIGQEFQVAAVGWEIAGRSNRPALALSIVGLVTAAPIILLALPAGQLADSLDRKKLSTLTTLAIGLSSAGLACVSLFHAPLLFMYVCLLFGATMAAIGGPSHSSLMAQIVPIEMYSNASTWSSSLYQISAMAGPALAGVAIAIGTLRLHAIALPTLPLVYLTDALACVASALLLMITQVPKFSKKTEAATLETLLAGIRFVRGKQIILATLSLDLFAVLLGGATYLLPIYAKDILHVGASEFGWMRAAPAMGAMAMAVLIAHLPPMKKAGRNLLLAVIGFGLATIIFGISRSFWLSLIMLILTGAFDNISVVVRHTLVQVLTPDAMRGRVSAVNNVFIGSSNELGGFESGLTAQLFGPVWSVVAGGIGTILVVIAVNSVWPQVRNFGSLNDARPEEENQPRGFEVTQKAVDV